jgi:hypothetical protein
LGNIGICEAVTPLLPACKCFIVTVLFVLRETNAFLFHRFPNKCRKMDNEWLIRLQYIAFFPVSERFSP